MLTDDAHSAGAAVDQPHRHRRDAGTDGELVSAARSVPDDLTHEFVAEHDVAFGVIQGPAGGVVDGKFGVVHEVHVGSTDRGTQRAQQQLARSGPGVGCFANL
jgi:hypothetical protein